MPAITTSGMPAAEASRATRTLRAMPPAIVPSSIRAPRLLGGERLRRPLADAHAVHVGEVDERRRAHRAGDAERGLVGVHVHGLAERAVRDGRDDGEEARRPTAPGAGAGSTRSGVPTRPRSGASLARTRPPSRPEMPIAGTPAAVRPAASSLLAVPESTISTTAIASGDVSRRPSTKRDSMCERLQQPVDRAAAAVHEDGRAVAAAHLLGERADEAGVLERRARRPCRRARSRGALPRRRRPRRGRPPPASPSRGSGSGWPGPPRPSRGCRGRRRRRRGRGRPRARRSGSRSSRPRPTGAAERRPSRGRRRVPS